MRVRCLALLLCLSIVGVSLDNVPDPPALCVHSSDICSFSVVDLHDHVKSHKQQPDFASCTHRYQESWFSFIHVFEDSSGLYQQPLIYHAADPSPPSISPIRVG